MTETQNINHCKPLAPGEIRTHAVGAETFRVMHVAGGSFTQAAVLPATGPTRVLATDRFESVAVRAYADAIEQAESDAIDALDDADGPCFTASGAYDDGGAAQRDRDDAHAEAAAEDRAYRPGHPMADREIDLSFNLPMGASRNLVEADVPRYPAGTPEHETYAAELRTELTKWAAGEEPYPYSTPRPPSLAELVNAYGEAMARGGIDMALAYGKGQPIDTAAAAHAELADALKAEILARFGGER